jgi:hypothetical protein
MGSLQNSNKGSDPTTAQSDMSTSPEMTTEYRSVGLRAAGIEKLVDAGNARGAAAEFYSLVRGYGEEAVGASDPQSTSPYKYAVTDAVVAIVNHPEADKIISRLPYFNQNDPQMSKVTDAYKELSTKVAEFKAIMNTDLGRSSFLGSNTEQGVIEKGTAKLKEIEELVTSDSNAPMGIDYHNLRVGILQEIPQRYKGKI